MSPSAASTDTGPVRRQLEASIERGEIAPDPAQRRLADLLDTVLEESQRERLSSKSSALGWLFGARRAERPAAARGLYVHGGVGRGKSMLMDMCFRLAPHRRKRRVHFHAFMADVHERIHAFRQAEGEREGDDPIPPVVAALAAEARLLCFDEFAVNDVADAMILSRLFTGLFREGVTVVATSNVAPRDLYPHGLNRASFMKFVDLVEERMRVFALDAETDYRQSKIAGSPTWFGAGDEGFDALWRKLLDGEAEGPETLSIKGRAITLERTGGGMARASFEALCGRPLGARDYLAIAERFHTLFLEAVPVLGHARRNEAKRFIALVDALYERRRRLVVEAAAEPDALYEARHGTEAFEFARTASRLVEMRGADWPPPAQTPAEGRETVAASND